MSLVIHGTDGVTFNDSSLQGAAASPYVLKNRIINGDMRIDQRNAGASVTPSTNVYTLDRWFAVMSAGSKYSVQQNAGSVTPPIGFNKYLGITSLSAYSITASDYFLIQQRIEGFNFADLDWGTANAKTVTLSFWVRSSLTGTFGGSLVNESDNRSYPFAYTISSANTWEYKTITIAGDTTGTWTGSTNGVGVKLNISIGIGSTLSGTAGAWAGSNLLSATGATSVVGTNGATFYITGVQLEIGTSATPFERRLYGTELALCQRYYWQSNATAGAWNYLGSGMNFSSTLSMIYVQYPVFMRSAPTVSTFGTINTTNVQVLVQGGTAGISAVAGAGATETNYFSTRIDCTSAAVTAGQGAIARFANGVGVTFSAEL